MVSPGAVRALAPNLVTPLRAFSSATLSGTPASYSSHGRIQIFRGPKLDTVVGGVLPSSSVTSSSYSNSGSGDITREKLKLQLPVVSFEVFLSKLNVQP